MVNMSFDIAPTVDWISMLENERGYFMCVLVILYDHRVLAPSKLIIKSGFLLDIGFLHIVNFSIGF